MVLVLRQTGFQQTLADFQAALFGGLDLLRTKFQGPSFARARSPSAAARGGEDDPSESFDIVFRRAAPGVVAPAGANVRAAARAASYFATNRRYSVS